VEAEFLTIEEASRQATEAVLWPYSSEEHDQSGEAD